MNIKDVLLVVGGVVIGLILSAFMFGKSPSQVVGAIANCSAGYTCYNYLDVLNDLVVDGATALTGAVTVTGDVVVNGGRIDANTSNVATSSINGGCFGTNATSTASVGHYAIGTSFISTSTFEGTVRAYPVFWVNGACPNL